MRTVACLSDRGPPNTCLAKRTNYDREKREKRERGERTHYVLTHAHNSITGPTGKM